ncbi:MAG: Cys-Gln thioester bond-forming surface protein, partial [Clostridiaceae bacterium]|nr:Cys-Gln thioester bond-forming surface protein [Clostridiaceae bacterium]
MKHKLKRLLSSVLAAATMFSSFAGVIPKAAAFSGGDSITLVYENDKQSYLREQKGGSWVNLPIHECYAVENGEKFQSFCMDHGKHGIHEVSPTTNRHTYILDPGSGYTQNPKAVGVIMRGCGRLTLQSFLNQFSSVPRDLTEDEYRYATQTAIWAALGQLSVSGTAFTSGNAVQISPSYGTEGARVMAAVKALLNYANTIDHNYYVGMYLRHGASHDQSGVIDWSPTSGSELNAEDIEDYDGEEYYTQEVKVASASFCQNNALKVGLADYLPGTLLQIVKDDNHASPADPVAYNGTPISTKPIAQTTDANANGSEYYSIVKVWVPKEAAEQETDYVFNVEASATVES